MFELSLVLRARCHRVGSLSHDLRLTQLPLHRSGFGRFRTLFVHEWNVVGRDDSRDVADHDACNAFNRLLSLVVYPRKDRDARLWRVVIRSVVAGKRAGVAVPTFAARNSQAKGSVAQEWDAI